MKKYLYFSSLILLVIFLITCKSAQETTIPKSNKKEILGPFVISGISNATYNYNSSAFTYTFTIPPGTNLSSLKIAFLISKGASISPDQNVERDYTNPVDYTVTAEDGSKQIYTFRVIQQGAPKSTEKQIIGFTFTSLNPVVSAIIDQTTFKITASVPATTDLSSLVPTLTISSNATVAPASGVAQNFTNAVNYKVTAEDGSTQIYTVQINKITPSLPTDLGCLVTRIEASDPNEFCTFEYDDLGRLKTAKYHSGGSADKYLVSVLLCSYNGSTNDLSDAFINGFQFKFLYKEGKLYFFASNNVAKDITYSYDITLNDANQIIFYQQRVGLQQNIDCENLAYQNGALLNRKDCFSSMGAQMEYNNTKNFMYSQRNSPSVMYMVNTFLSNFDEDKLHDFNLGYDSPFVNLFGYFLPSKINYIDRNSPSNIFYANSTISFEKNSTGYPRSMRIIYTEGANTLFPRSFQTSYKITYGGCQ